MCGIAGIIDFAGRPVLQEELKKMTDAIAHRGPDGEGFFTKGNVGFGHRRLSIIDLSNAAAQPMTRFGLTITYNGEIYNYIELRKELEQQEIVFTTQSDTEVILAAYHRWGKDCVQRFNGMWAFAIYDAANKEVFLSRDRFGEKPLYYTESEGRFIFCSEIKGILPVIPSVSPNPESIARFLLHGQAEFSVATFFEQIFSLVPGSNSIIDVSSGRKDINQYYHPLASIKQEPLSMESALARFESVFTDAVKLRLRSDVEVGGCLSGGIDSSIITAVVADLYGHQGQEFKALSAGSLTKQLDELSYATAVAQHCGIAQHKVQPNASTLERAVGPAHLAQESPLHSPSPLLQWLLFEAAAANGLKVMLDGQGADELCLGYTTHLSWALSHGSHITSVGDFTTLKKNYAIGNIQLAKLFIQGHYPAGKKWYQQLLWPKLRSSIKQNMCSDANGMMLEATLQGMQTAELSNGTLPLLLRYEDRNAMAHGVETRLPFLDNELAALLLSLPLSFKINEGWSKYLLRKFAGQHLPENIAWRRGKIGFDPGDFRLYRQQSSPVLRDFLGEHVFVQSLHGPRWENTGAQWRWQSLQIWYHTFFE